MNSVELIYDRDCPNVANTRAHLLCAFAEVGLTASWTEWDRGDPDSPPYVTGYGSPTILVNGKDVTGAEPASGISSCRLYDDGSNGLTGVPSVLTISTALRVTVLSPFRGPLRSQQGGWPSSLATLPGIVAGVLPVGICPACWPVYAGVLSAMGLGFLMEGAYLLPLTASLLLGAVASLAYRAGSRRGYGPFVLGLLASALLLVGKFRFTSGLSVYGGVAVLVAASVWNAWPRLATEPETAACPACVPDGAPPHPSNYPGA